MSNSLNLRPLLSPPEWLVEEKEFDANKLNFYETIFNIEFLKQDKNGTI